MDIEKSSEKPFNVRGYRDALGCFGTGVCLILTEDDEGQVRGITANSFSSVSLHPPIILWSVDISSDRCQMFTNAKRFSVNMLRSDQRDLSSKFAVNTTAHLAEADVLRGEFGTPMLADALGSLECETSWRQKAGDHVVIFGAVTSFVARDGEALGFFKGQYVPLNAEKS
ncbi:MAG: hypothetical protein CMK07_02285 [Ponticaulis sp.]|nr:hypothetical protein [Ponticaulis sp.]